MASLLQLSHELLHCIFIEIEPADLSNVNLTCRTLRSYIRGNWLLHKDIYLRLYDEPTNAPDYEEHLHNLVKVDKIFHSHCSLERKASYLPFVTTQVKSLINTAQTTWDKSKNMEFLTAAFKRQDNVIAYLCASSLFARAGNGHQQPAETPELRQSSAKLHCLYGVPIDDPLDPVRYPRLVLHDHQLTPADYTYSARHHVTHPHARSKVYDLREYCKNTLWGPFTSDGSHRVDWEKVEAIMIVLGFNLRRFTSRSNGVFGDVWNTPWLGVTPNSYLSIPRSPSSIQQCIDCDPDHITPDLARTLDAQDPYGVSGTWMRVVCFLDYNDLYAFNFGPGTSAEGLREAIDCEEAIRLIRIKLQVTRVDPPGTSDDDSDDAHLDWSNFVGERLPVIHFRGTSRSLHASWDNNGNSHIRGSVRQTPEGEIRWTTFSIFNGEERWRSEGIQVGGLRSARGVLGNWFDKDFDTHGPAGPTAFWKESDEFDIEKPRGPIIWDPFNVLTDE